MPINLIHLFFNALIYLGLGFAWEWETQYTITTINEGGSADKILMTGDKIIQVFTCLDNVVKVEHLDKYI